MNTPYAIFFIVVNGRCILTNPNLAQYGNYVVRPLLLSLLPGAILITTGSLTYHNITLINRIRMRDSFQRSLTSMLLLQSFLTVIPMLPFAITNIYQTATASVAKSPYRLAQETLVFDISSILLYLSYASNFYIYLVSSVAYRRDFLDFIRCRYSRGRWANRVGPETRHQIEMNTASVMRNPTNT